MVIRKAGQLCVQFFSCRNNILNDHETAVRIFMDLSLAFGSIDYSVLLAKMKKMSAVLEANSSETASRLV